MMSNLFMLILLNFAGGLLASASCNPVLSAVPLGQFDIGQGATSVAWQQIGSSYYLAAGNVTLPAGPEVRVLQFNPVTGFLSGLATAVFEVGTTVRSVAWQAIGSSYYLAVGNDSTAAGPELRVLQFNPATQLLSGLATAVLEVGTTVQSVAWQQIGSSYYLAVGTAFSSSGPEVRVLQFNPTTTTLSSLALATFEIGQGVNSVAWQQIGSSYYLAVGNSDLVSGPEVRVLEFNPTTTTLSSLGSATLDISGGAPDVAWQQIGSSYYLAVGSNNIVGPEVRVLQFNPTTAILNSLISATFEVGTSMTSVVWQQIGSSYYVAAGNVSFITGPEVRVLEFNPTTVILRGQASATFEVGTNVDSVAWQQIGSSYYVAAGNGSFIIGPEVRVLEFNPCPGVTPSPAPGGSSEDVIESLPLATYDNNATVISVAWQNIDASYFIALGGALNFASPEVRVVQFDPASGLFNLASAVFEYSANVHSVAWHTINGSYYIACGGAVRSGAEVAILQFNPLSRVLSALNSATFENGANINSVAWHTMNGSHYLALASDALPSGPEVRILQFNQSAGTLSTLASATFEYGANANTVAWQEINGVAYVLAGGAIGSGSGALMSVLAFNQTTALLSEVASAQYVYPGKINSLMWQQAGGSHYIALAGTTLNASQVQILAFDAAAQTVSMVASATFGSLVAGLSASWQQINSSYYLVIGGSNGGSGPEMWVLQFDPVSHALTAPSLATFENSTTVNSVAWQAIGSSYYIALGGVRDASLGYSMRVVQFETPAAIQQPVGSFAQALVNKYYGLLHGLA